MKWAAWALLLAPVVAQAGTTWFPGDRTFGTLLFEDQWPCTGDRDFNDVALRYNVEKIDDDGDGVVERMVMHIQPEALGASLCNGIGLRLPAPTASVSTATLRWGSVDGATWSAAEPVEVTDTAGEPVLWLADDLRAEACGGAEGFLNTDPDAPVTGCATLEVDVRFRANPGPLDTEPFDLFVHRCADRTVQIHRSAYPGTDELATGRLGTCNDASTGGRWFVHGGSLDGLPFALNLGEGLDDEGDGLGAWPVEEARVETAWPGILTFATGSGGADFYKAGTVEALVFRQGQLVDPPPPRIHERKDGSGGHPADDCAQLHADWPLLGTGRYLVDPQGAGAFRAYCDMDTAPGGWTLCLNSRYTAAASALFTTSYAKVPSGPDNPGGYYDWCPQDGDEYLMALADVTPTGFDLHDAVLRIQDPTPWTSYTSEWNDVGVQSSNVTWIEKHPSLPYPSQCSSISVSFWEFVHPGPRSLHGYKRGHFYCHQDTHTIFLFGAGCNYGGCGISGSSVQAPQFIDSDQSMAGWAWRVRASASYGRYDSGFQVGPIQGDRVQIYYR